MDRSQELSPTITAVTSGHFRKRPLVVEAEQIRLSIFGFNPFVGGWPTSNNPFGVVVMRRPRWWKSPVPMIETLEGWLTVSPGDWVIQGVKGEFYPCKPDVFAATYEPVPSSAEQVEGQVPGMEQ